jgi:hypothetical protein
VYNGGSLHNNTNTENTLNEFNTVHPKIKFTMDKETRNRIKYLDMTIIKEHNKLIFNIYRKPTTTGSIIHNASCHPNEHKISAMNYLLDRMNIYTLTRENKDRELRIINEILKNNGYGYQQLPTNFQYKNKASINPTQTTYALVVPVLSRLINKILNSHNTSWKVDISVHLTRWTKP